MNHKKRFFAHKRLSMWERTSHGRSRDRSAREVEAPYDPLSVRLREVLQESRKTIYQVSADTGIDGAYIWRIVRGDRVEVSREVLLLLSLAMVLDRSRLDEVVEIINRVLDAGGYRQLRGR